MPQGDKSAYTNKQKRKAEHIEEGYEKRGVSSREAERRAWATVNKESGGGKKSGSGRGRRARRAPAEKAEGRAALRQHAARKLHVLPPPERVLRPGAERRRARRVRARAQAEAERALAGAAAERRRAASRLR